MYPVDGLTHREEIFPGIVKHGDLSTDLRTERAAESLVGVLAVRV